MSLLRCVVAAVGQWATLTTSAPSLTPLRSMSATGLRVIDSHIHLWTPDVERFPRAPDTPAIPSHLEPRGTIEEMHRNMVAAGITGTLVVQPVNYGQDYSYMKTASEQFPGFFKGMLVADPSAEDPERALRDIVKSAPGFWVGVRFNPYKWPNAVMNDDVGQRLFSVAGELGLPVGFMPIKGLGVHIEAIESLMQAFPATTVIIDHWGFHVQPFTGFGDDRKVEEEHWEILLRLGKEYPQVHVKLSGAFRNSLQPLPFIDLAPRLEQLAAVFSTKRLLWGSDAPYYLDFGAYKDAVGFLSSWPAWQRLDDQQREDILHGTSERLFGVWGQQSGQATAHEMVETVGAEL